MKKKRKDLPSRRKHREFPKSKQRHQDKQVEEKLGQSEERYRSIFDRMLDGIYLSTHEGRFVDVNPAFVKMFRYSSKQEMLAIVDIKKELYFTPEERGSHILDTGQEEVEVYRMRRKDGSEIWVEDHGRYVHDDEGNVVYHEGILRDVTERRLAEQKLRLQAEITENMFEGLVLIREADGVIVQTNPRFDAMFGYSPGELIRKNIATVNASIDGKSSEDVAKEIIASLRETGSWSGELRNVKKDGTPFWCQANVSTLGSSEYGAIWVATHEDITEYKRLEEELKQYSTNLEELVKERSGKLAESEAQYRRLFESSPISLWEEDFSEVKKYLDDLQRRGIKDLRRYFMEHPEDLDRSASMVKILNVNETALNLYGAKTVEELRGELRRVFTYEFHDKFREELVALGEGKTRFASEFDNQTLTGDIKHVDLILSVIPGYEDTLAKVLVCIIDLTEWKEMEQRLQQAERLAAVGETAAMVGHDLRNPLQGITGAVHLLKQESLTVKERDEMLRLIQSSVDYSDAIVRDLMEYSAEIHLKPVETTPKSIIRDAVRTVKVPEKVTLRDLSQEHPAIRVDLDKMRRVIINIVENAIDAMPQGGTLTISSSQSNCSVEITISDTGSGIPDRIMKNLWKPLQTTKAKGLGLGLAICKRIVDAHGGSISVKSKASEGTNVTIRLPIKLEVEVKQK